MQQAAGAPTQSGERAEESNQREWLTAAEAAAYAGRIGIWTVRQACKRNELRHVRVGGHWRGPIRTRKEWVAEWLRKWTRGGDGGI
jgi:hypothetical protein